MTRVLIVMLLAISASAQAPANGVKSACGPQNAAFDMTTEPADQPQAVEPGKARAYFIQDDGPGGVHQHYTVRIGLDGGWVGAYKHNSYFTISVSPGEHHICANVQSKSPAGRNFAFAHFTAEPGKTYYFRTQFLAGLTTQYPIYPYLALDQPDSDEAMYLITSFPLSVPQHNP
jgi:hypothetical protein